MEYYYIPKEVMILQDFVKYSWILSKKRFHLKLVKVYFLHNDFSTFFFLIKKLE